MKSKKEIKEEFNRLQNQYIRLGKNLEEALKTFLETEKIPFLSVNYRVKDFESFYEKIGRKSYEDPFNDIEDICGLRIVCYYISDIDKIENIIKREFNVLETEDKSESLGLKEFAYRSVHNIVKVNDSWVATPNYRGLNDIKAEIQTRTILMHAWAEVEHKLNYKSDAQVPVNFQRKLFRLSAKFEEADEQFEELRNGIFSYRNSIIDKAKLDNKFDVNQDLNKDSLIAFFNYYFPDCHSIPENHLDAFFDSIIENNVNFEELGYTFKIIIPFQDEILMDLDKSGYGNNLLGIPTELIGFGLHTIGRINMDDNIEKSWSSVVKKWQKKINSVRN